MAWNLTRVKGWADNLHFDYLTDLAAATDDELAAAQIAAEVIRAQQTVHKSFVEMTEKRKMGNFQSHYFLLKKDYKSLSEMEGFSRFSGDSVTIAKDRRTKPALIHGQSGSVAAGGSRCLSLTREQLKQAPEGAGFGWDASVVCVNSDAVFMRLWYSLIICDGDVGLISQGGLPGRSSGVVIIANGDVDVYETFSLSRSFVYAAGNYSGSKLNVQRGNSIITGGKNPLIPPEDSPLFPNYCEGVKVNPLGVKFVSPADAGVELAVGLKVVRFGAIKADTPIATAGLEKGDRILKLNGVTIETAADFRRQLRESLLWGTGLFEIKRGDQTFLRLVKFAEPPKK